MAVSAQYVDYILDQLVESGEARPKRMFGGVGIYVDEVFCGIISSSSQFYLRTDDSNRGDFEERGMKQFPGKRGAGMPYHEVPAEILEDASDLAEWVRKARSAAVAAAPKKKPTRRK
jgi:DNA transformation protein